MGDDTFRLKSVEPLKREIIDELVVSTEGYVQRVKKLLERLEKEENAFKNNK